MPVRLFMDGLKQFFVRHKTVALRDKTEFIRSMAKDIDQKPAQVFDFELMVTFTQNKSP
jgi:hypothetical protein